MRGGETSPVLALPHAAGPAVRARPAALRPHTPAHTRTVHGEIAVARHGDWIIPEAEPGRFYPCKPDVFAATYEAVEEVPPHSECPVGQPQASPIGVARIGLKVEPGLADGIASVELGDAVVVLPAGDRVLVPAVELRGVKSLSLRGAPGAARQVLTGGADARFTIDGIRYATSAEHPVIVEPFGPGTEGGFVTLTLVASEVEIDGREVGDV